MSYTKIVCVATLSLSIAAIGSATAKDKKNNYNVSAFSIYESLPVNDQAAALTTQKAAEALPGWTISTDKLNGLLTDIYGTPIALPGSTPAAKAQGCMDQQLSSLGVNKAEWKQVSDVDAPKAHYINYTQSVNGHTVVFAKLGFRFTKAGTLARIQMKNYGSPSKGTPALTAKSAKAAAVKDLANVTITSAQIDKEWSWFPVPREGGYDLHPAWHFRITGKADGSVPLKLTGYVDATNGTILYRTNEVKETGTYDLTVKGMVYKDGTLHPATLEPLPDLGLDIAASTYFTDSAGLYSSSSLLLPLSTTVPLAGKWSTVIDSITGLTPSFTDLVSLPGTTYTYPTTAPSSDRHVNAYYHVNRVHNFMKYFYPTFTGMDFSLPTNVDLTSGTCNAFYDGTAINFYAAGGGCNSFANVGDVIYHEYGHGISDHFYTDISGTTINNGALNEANSDIWALSITHNPVLAENAFVGYGGFIRRYDNTPQVYPIDLNTSPFAADPHQNGQIIAGTWWDVGVNLGSVDSMTKLFTDVYYDVPDGPDGTEGAIYQSILIDALMADDTNSNLHDGTPHYSQIVSAFAKHGIYLEKNSVLSHTELATPQVADAPIAVSAILNISSVTYFHDLTMYYRINGTGAWTSLVMSGTMPNFSGVIPAQPEGTTVEYYFIVHDALNEPNAYFPITCNSAMAANQTSIPFQFGVGMHRVDGSNFESTATGWHIGLSPGDDATAGRWHQAVPVASSATFFSITAWPGHDHTTGSGKCLITGLANPYPGTGVGNGTSSVVSPVFDISGYTAPVVEYYRWFSNEQGANFKSDPFRVTISDGTGPWQLVENTYQADVKWRHRIFPVSAYFPAGAATIQMKFYASDSVLSNWDNNGQSTTVCGMDDFFIYDKGVIPVSVTNPAFSKAEIFPNPADQQVNIQLQGYNTGHIKLYDMSGRQVASETTISPATSTYSLDTKSLAAGAYNLVIQTGKSIQSNKIVVQHQ